MSTVSKKQEQLAASQSQPQVALIWEKSTQPLMASLVRNGLTKIRMITVSPMLEITTSVGTLLGLLIPSCGAIPLTLNMSVRIVQFHSAPL